ncbi:hypothetical protein ACFQQB_24600 [Nonomuraea rubra]|uniref:hypothetical protein n=1 Tax=Nonomuraea rubra TaxID=46180 RepID=UPI00360F16F2
MAQDESTIGRGPGDGRLHVTSAGRRDTGDAISRFVLTASRRDVASGRFGGAAGQTGGTIGRIGGAAGQTGGTIGRFGGAAGQTGGTIGRFGGAAGWGGVRSVGSVGRWVGGRFGVRVYGVSAAMTRSWLRIIAATRGSGSTSP